jgi:hypothetical protein
LKRQYLGDARDAFKWEYQDHLTRHLGYSRLQIVPMLTEDDATNEGMTHPSRYPAADAFRVFCLKLRRSRALVDLHDLPTLMPGDYQVLLHRPDEVFSESGRAAYFSDINGASDQVVFVDPDIGFEPKGRYEKHVAFADITAILDQVSYDSVVSVYQHQRQGESYIDTIADIRRRLPMDHCVAIYGHHVMFVAISRSRPCIETVSEANVQYAAARNLSTS